MATINLNLVRVFVTVAETGSFTAAAKTLEVPTSSVSRAVARLEADLGATLLDRTSRRVSLTAPGRAYVEHAQKAITALDEGEARLGEVLDQPRGEVKLSIPVNLDGGFLAEQLVRFGRSHPQVRVRVVPTNRWVDIQQEGFDLALRVMQRPEGTDLVFRELGSFHAWLVASPAYLKKHGTPRRPSDLTHHACINMQSYALSLRLIGPRRIETVEVSGPIIANDMSFVRQLAERGAGIGPLVFSPGDEPTLGELLVRVLPTHIVEGPKLFVVSTSRKSQPLRVRLLRDALIEAYARVKP